MSIFRTYGENKELMEWLNEYLLPKEKELTPELIYNFSLLMEILLWKIERC